MMIDYDQNIVCESMAICNEGPYAKGAPTKNPETRVQQLRMAGELGIPFTTGQLRFCKDSYNMDLNELNRSLHNSI